MMGTAGLKKGAHPTGIFGQDYSPLSVTLPVPVPASGLWNPAQPRIAAQEKIARVQGLHLKIGTITGNDQPMAYFISE
jgi:hypothetical protein